MNLLENCIKIYDDTMSGEEKADQLFELIFKQANPKYKIPDNDKLLKYGKKLKLDGLKIIDNHFIFYIYYDELDFTDRLELSPFIFFWKIILKEQKALGITFP